MRTIKFRAWNVREKEWFDEWFSVSADGNLLYHENGDSFDIPKEYAVVQYTGFLDKNGKEIFEGDVIDMKSLGEQFGKRVISWTHGGFNHPLDVEKCEIIGNIYENPELLS